MYKTLNEHYKEKFGCKVYKLSVDAGFSCPNRDGTVGTKGCIFCSEKGSGEFAVSGNDILLQLERAKEKVSRKIKDGKYIAYFQSFTNTYADISTLEILYKTAISPDYIVGISIATRPDCISDEVLALLDEINKIKPVYIELGLQSACDKTAEYIRRGYKTQVYFDTVKRLKAKGINVVTHIIIGLPNETKADAVNTTKRVVEAGSDGVKFHLLYVIKGTDLEKDYNNGLFKCLTFQEYADILKECISVLPCDTVVHRITGDGAKKDLVAPIWSGDKKKVLNGLKEYLNMPLQ